MLKVAKRCSIFFFVVNWSSFNESLAEQQEIQADNFTTWKIRDEPYFCEQSEWNEWMKSLRSVLVTPACIQSVTLTMHYMAE